MSAKILCVEDEPSILGLQLTILQRLGYQTLSATNGLDAYEIILKERPDAVVLDVMLPGCDGFTLARKIRSNDAIESTPVAFVTAKGECHDFRHGFRCGGQIYLSKPFSASAFQVAVESLLQKKARPAPKKKAPAPVTRRKRFFF